MFNAFLPSLILVGFCITALYLRHVYEENRRYKRQFIRQCPSYTASVENMHYEARWLFTSINRVVDYEGICAAEDAIQKFAETYHTLYGFETQLFPLLNLLAIVRQEVRKLEEIKPVDVRYSDEDSL